MKAYLPLNEMPAVCTECPCYSNPLKACQRLKNRDGGAWELESPHYRRSPNCPLKPVRSSIKELVDDIMAEELGNAEPTPEREQRPRKIMTQAEVDAKLKASVHRPEPTVSKTETVDVEVKQCRNCDPKPCTCDMPEDDGDCESEDDTDDDDFDVSAIRYCQRELDRVLARNAKLKAEIAELKADRDGWKQAAMDRPPLQDHKDLQAEITELRSGGYYDNIKYASDKAMASLQAKDAEIAELRQFVKDRDEEIADLLKDCNNCNEKAQAQWLAEKLEGNGVEPQYDSDGKMRGSIVWGDASCGASAEAWIIEAKRATSGLADGAADLINKRMP